MPILTLSQYKGGVGKTTAAICLATLFQRREPTLLIDSDPNRSASKVWARKGRLPFRVSDDIEARKLLMRGEFKSIVIDTPARPAADEIESLAKGCDLLILPSTPDPLSLAALVDIARSLPANTNYRCLITKCPPKPQRDGAEAQAFLERANLPVFNTMIRHYKAYMRAAEQGEIVSNVRNGGIPWHDWQSLWEELQNVL